MADFRNLEVYQISKTFNLETYQILKTNKGIQRAYKDQFLRAALSICLNIAEGSGRFTNKDKRHFYVIARGSAQECMAMVDILLSLNLITAEMAETMLKRAESISRILFAIIRNLSD